MVGLQIAREEFDKILRTFSIVCGCYVLYRWGTAAVLGYFIILIRRQHHARQRFEISDCFGFLLQHLVEI